MDTLKWMEQNKATLVLILPTIYLIVVFKYTVLDSTITTTNKMVYSFSNNNSNLYSRSKYLVNSNKCKIPDLDPFNNEIKRFYRKDSFVQCGTLDPLTYVTKNENSTEAYLHIDTQLIPAYTRGNVVCCLSNITRHAKGTKSIDNNILLSKCTDFFHNITLPEKPVLVKCRNSKTYQEVFNNTYAPIIVRKSIQDKIKNIDKSSKPLNVLFIGLDSISRLNMMRLLPTTKRYLDNCGWLQMQGYNKVGDNTYPNLMAVLTGRNTSSIYTDCDPTQTGKLDKCNFVWNDYRNKGYVTSYAEGHTLMSTFNYCKVGFQNEPADYYFRPYALASEMLKTTYLDESKYCLGPLSYFERILKYTEDFSTTFKDVPNFGLFWLNFAHNKMNAGSRFDLKLKKFFETLTNKGILDNSVVIFLSDHGLRFGEILYTYSGWLEVRLPFFYIWIPKWFQEKYPVEYGNMRLNANKLTTPFDLYMTLQDILVYSSRNFTVQPCTGCSNCKSLFSQIPTERSCQDACISSHWCACTNFETISTNNSIVQEAANHFIHHIQNILSRRKDAQKCARYKLKHVISSRISTGSTATSDSFIVLIIQTVPSAVFESTISFNLTTSNINPFRVQTGISRLDYYKPHSNCVGNAYLKTLCYCHK